MSDYRQWRRNPFTGIVNPATFAEEHEVVYWGNFNAYGIQLREGILRRTPSTVSIPGLNEVGFNTPPSVNDFRVDYDPLNQAGQLIDAVPFNNTGFIELHPSREGQVFNVTYEGTGLLNIPSNIPFLLVEAGVIPGTISMDGNKITDLEPGDQPTDAVNFGQLSSSRILDITDLVAGSYVSGASPVTINLPDSGNWIIILQAALSISGTDPDSELRINGNSIYGENYTSGQITATLFGMGSFRLIGAGSFNIDCTGANAEANVVAGYAMRLS
jgi:hypothetical protein